MIPLVRTRFDRFALPLGVLGLVAVGVVNWRQWQRDKAVLAERAEPSPLPPLSEWPELPLVSVLVAAWNESKHIDRHIRSFLALRYPHKELVLCAGGDDDTLERACRYAGPQVKVLAQQSGEGKQRALARSFPETEGGVIFLTDADCELADEPFERTLWPVVAEDEQVATGSYVPVKWQLVEPFAFTQAASQAYSAIYSERHVSGLSGANCATHRRLIGELRAFDEPAPSGTDYVLAKTLDSAGVRIRQVPDSRMPTDYPATATQYLRQQRRWLRNVALHGRRYRANDEMRASLQTSATGAIMLILPLLGVLLSSWLLIGWFILLAQALLARMRYLAVGAAILGRSIAAPDVVWQGPILWLDFIAWVQPFADYIDPKRRSSW